MYLVNTNLPKNFSLIYCYNFVMNKRYSYKKNGYSVYRTRRSSSPRRSSSSRSSAGNYLISSFSRFIARAITNWLFKK